MLCLKVSINLDVEMKQYDESNPIILLQKSLAWHLMV